jgi:hypothetical protein
MGDKQHEMHRGKQIMKAGIACIAIILLAGCATSYQPISDSGGYYRQRINKNTFIVGFKANGFTHYDRAHDFALLRAAQIGNYLGYKYFIVDGLSDRTKTNDSDALVTGVGNGGFFSGIASSLETKKPGLALKVHYLKNKPQHRVIELYWISSEIDRVVNKYDLKNVPRIQMSRQAYAGG